MKMIYDPTPDSHYIELAASPVTDSRPLTEGVVGDFDSSGALVGLDIERASAKVDLDRFVSEGPPSHRTTHAA